MHNIRFIVLLLKGHRMLMLLGILAATAVVGLNAWLLALSGWFITSMAVAGASGAAFNYFYASATIRALAITRTLGRYGERLLTHDITLRFLVKCRTWLFLKLIPRVPVPFERYTAGEISGRLRHDLDSLESLYLRGLAPLLSGVFVIIAGTLFIARYHQTAAMVFAGITGVLSICWPLLRYRHSKVQGYAMVKSQSELRHSILQGLEGAEELILLGGIDEQSAHTRTIAAGLIRQHVDQQREQHIINSLITSGSGVTTIALITIIVADCMNKTISGPQLVMLLLFVLGCFEALGPLATAIHLFPQTQAALGRIKEISFAPVEVPSGTLAQPDSISIQCSLENIRHAPQSPVLCQALTFTISAGEVLAIIGKSGVGKSTVIDILSGLRPYQGSIQIGVRELRDLTAEARCELIQVVPQQPHLFSASIRENIVLDRICTEDQLADALEISGLKSWIDSLPEGLNTSVGEQGSWISGGEARRIALARVCLDPRPIILLDEPTEGLDPLTEQLVLEQFFAKTAQSTCIMATHRKAPLAFAHQVLSIT
ncbi:MAG: thiol reductant ABC exporter subunit CydC [Trichlorobacter sp.]